MSASWAHRAFAVAAALGIALLVAGALPRVEGEALAFGGSELARGLSLLPLALALGLVGARLARRRRGSGRAARGPAGGHARESDDTPRAREA